MILTALKNAVSSINKGFKKFVAKNLKAKFRKADLPSIKQEMLDAELRAEMDSGIFNGEKIRSLVTEGASVDTISLEEKLPLIFFVIMHGDFELANFLLWKNVDVNVTLKSGFSILHQVAYYGSEPFTGEEEKFIRHVITKVKDINAIAKSRDTALSFALGMHNSSIAKLFLELGADPNVLHEGEGLPVVFVNISWHPESWKVLLDSNVDIQKKGKLGLTIAELVREAVSCFEGSVDASQVKNGKIILNILEAEPERRAQKMRDLVRRNVVLQRDIPDSEMPNKMKFCIKRAP